MNVPASPLDIRLRNGRKIRATFRSEDAQRHDLAALGRVGAANHRRAMAAIQHQGDALETLRRSDEGLSKKVGRVAWMVDTGADVG